MCLVTGQQPGARSQRAPECCEVALASRPGIWPDVFLQWPYRLLGGLALCEILPACSGYVTVNKSLNLTLLGLPYFSEQ